MIEGKRDRLVVYTALFGSYDNLLDPSCDVEGCDFICFTDQHDLKSNVWDVRLIEDCDLPASLMNRRYKILPHLYLSEYESSLYVDANIEILKNPYALKAMYLQRENFVIPRHFARSCIYDEAFVLLRSGRVKKLEVLRQMISYLRQGYRDQIEMGENNILLRNHNELVRFMNMWWDELNVRSKRDQLCLSFVAWKSGFRIAIAPIGARGGTWFYAREHATRFRRNVVLKLIDHVCFAVPFQVLRIMLLRHRNLP